MDNKFSQLEIALNTILNINIAKDIRLKELRKIEEYADGLIYLTEDKRKLLFGAIKALRYELKKDSTNEECIGGYNKILKEILSINTSLKNPKCIIYGDNWLSEEITKKMRDNHYCTFSWHTVNPAYLNEYDLYILCEEPLKVYNIPAIEDKDKLIKIWDYLKYKYIVFPSFYEIYMKFKRKCERKVKCLVTGNTNIVSAVRTSMLHTSAATLANNAQDIFYDFKMFNHAYKATPDLEYVIIGLVPYSLRYDASKSKVEWRRCLVYYPLVESMHNYDEAAHLITIYESENQKIKQYFSESDMDSFYNIFEKLEKSEKKDFIEVYDEKTCSKECSALNLREISELYNRPSVEVFLENKLLLEEYVKLCKSKNLKIIFFIPPYTDWYKERMQKSYYEELLEFTNELSTKYEAKVVDMMNVSLPDSCFSDYANVNSIGAVKIASYINEVIDG